MSVEQDMLSELKEISFLMQDVNEIRNGSYEPPHGATVDGSKKYKTPNDIHAAIEKLQERQEANANDLYELLQHIGRTLESIDDKLRLIKNSAEMTEAYAGDISSNQ